MVIIAGAYVFDSCHKEIPTPVTKHQNDKSSHEFGLGEVFFYNPVSSFKIMTGIDKLLSKILFTIGQDRFLSSFHNQKTFHLIKAEAIKVPSPLNPMVYFREFIICHQSSSDDNPPLS